jgi:putative protein-disulfide isomerase
MTRQDASAATLHYIFDPFCGWCYAAAPLIEAARTVPNLAVSLHAGGMMAGAARRRVDAQWREFVLPHDHRIAQLSGQPFGAAYFDGLLRDTSAVLDSEPPIRAILAAEELAGRGFDLAHALQKAHYVRGLRIADTAVLQQVAAEIGLDASAFAQVLSHVSHERFDAHVTHSRNLLAKVGGRGFPTIVLQLEGEEPTVLELGSYLGRPQAFAEHLTKRMAGAAAKPAEAGLAASCDAQGCAVDS